LTGRGPIESAFTWRTNRLLKSSSIAAAKAGARNLARHSC